MIILIDRGSGSPAKLLEGEPYIDFENKILYIGSNEYNIEFLSVSAKQEISNKVLNSSNEISIDCIKVKNAPKGYYLGSNGNGKVTWLKIPEQTKNNNSPLKISDNIDGGTW